MVGVGTKLLLRDRLRRNESPRLTIPAKEQYNQNVNVGMHKSNISMAQKFILNQELRSLKSHISTGFGLLPV